MQQPIVNTFRDLLFQLPESDKYVILCTQKMANGVYNVLATKGNDEWKLVQSSCQVTTTERSMGSDSDAVGMALAGYPQNRNGYTYFLFIRYTAALSVTSWKLTEILTDAVQKHDQVVAAPPQAEVVAILQALAENVHMVTVYYTIDFATRTYQMTQYRVCGMLPTEYGVELDPLGFEMALKIAGWRMADPPNYKTQNNFTGYARGTNNNYTAILMRDDDGPRYMISSVTDRQERRKREQGIAAHFMRKVEENTGLVAVV